MIYIPNGNRFSCSAEEIKRKKEQGTTPTENERIQFFDFIIILLTESFQISSIKNLIKKVGMSKIFFIIYLPNDNIFLFCHILLQNGF